MDDGCQAKKEDGMGGVGSSGAAADLVDIVIHGALGDRLVAPLRDLACQQLVEGAHHRLEVAGMSEGDGPDGRSQFGGGPKAILCSATYRGGLYIVGCRHIHQEHVGRAVEDEAQALG
jgi:hypothetical protein